nr:MAG TPA: Mor transcription activator family [Caudoviricetes sp.]
MKKQGKTSKQGKALLQDLKTHTEHLLSEVNLSPDQARQVANELMFQISQHWGGQLIYVVKDSKFLADKRDVEIYRAFNGHNHAELSQEYGLSLPYIYRILKRMNELERTQNQFELFDAI